MRLSYFVLAYRGAIAKWFIITLMGVLAVSEPSRRLPPLAEFVIESAALLLVVGAIVGRLWTSVFISGHKNRTLVTEGPYSVVRNPLYLFSLMGVIGIGLATGSVVLLAAIVGAFVVLYAGTISAEESQLEEILGEPYRGYLMRTPRLLPEWRAYREADTQTLSPAAYRRALFDTLWFFWVYGAVKVVATLHALDVLPSLFELY